MKIHQADYEVELRQLFQLAKINMKNGRHLEFYKMIVLIMLSEYQDLLPQPVRFHENPLNSS